MSRRFPNGTTIIIVHPGPPDLSDSTGLIVNIKARLMGGEIGILEPGVRFIESPLLDEPLFPNINLKPEPTPPGPPRKGRGGKLKRW